MSKANDSIKEKIYIDGFNLKLEEVVAVSRGYEKGDKTFYPQVELTDETKTRLKEVRDYVEENWLTENAPTIYGFNTGVGPLKDTRISPEENDLFQELLLESHAASIGEIAPIDVVRATMLMRANTLARGVSGIRLEVVERILEMLNKEVHPVIPVQGSLGASGDLPSLSHLSCSMVGHEKAESFYKGQRLPAKEALKKAQIEPVEYKLKAKDVLAIINGCTFSLGFAALGLEDGFNLLKNANLTAALSIEVMRGEMAAFDKRIQEARNQPGQAKMAQIIREYLEDSEWTTDDARKVKLPNEKREGEWQPRVQDAYTLRCLPQVHGATYDVLVHALEVLEREMNAAADNPLIFEKEDGEGYDVLSGGNFHGQYLAYIADFLAISLHEIGNFSERRSARLIGPALSYGLPQNLVGGKVGLNSGFIVAQGSASSLAMENKSLCFPASADSLPTKNSQEDHVSMATWACRKLHNIIDNARKIIAIEFLCAAQGVSLVEPHLKEFKRSNVTKSAYNAFRNRVEATKEDRYIHEKMQTANELIKDNILLKEVGEETGKF